MPKSEKRKAQHRKWQNKKWADDAEYRRRRMDYQRNYRKTPAGKQNRKNEKLKSNFAITLERYNEMLESQRGGCKICNIVFDNKIKPHVDHCHKTGLVRGLLCGACNKGLGFFQDNQDIISRAAVYLALSAVNQ